MAKPQVPPPLMLIEWEDATALDDERWVDVKEKWEYDPAIIKTVAYVLLNCPKGLIVTSHWCPEHTGPVDQIPRGMIRKITKLKV